MPTGQPDGAFSQVRSHFSVFAKLTENNQDTCKSIADAQVAGKHMLAHSGRLVLRFKDNYSKNPSLGIHQEMVAQYREKSCGEA